MTHSSALTLAIEARGVAVLTLNRPQLHNAFDDLLIGELLAALRQAAADPRVRVLLLAANGKSFSAGADLGWMRRMADAGRDENLRDAQRLSLLMETLDRFPAPTIAKVQGAAMGGGIGLVACCDIALAARPAVFSFSEVRLGLAPAVISPYAIAKIGVSQARRYFVTAEKFSAQRALALGLVHEVADANALDAATEQMVNTLLANGPLAMRAAKALVGAAASSREPAALHTANAGVIADLRASAEGREGLRAFLEKSAPAWSDDKG
ncbi:MAG: gamma-carboxygeranoyl-CoA hydratase [Herbaspirillum sp.]|jgi:methylglutaconyl-CoA hydratase|nr:gamma-carboxygeranoyl-CoA hydratase [Herbaspirillum sp.]